MVPIRGMVRIYLESEQRAALKWRCKLALHRLPRLHHHDKIGLTRTQYLLVRQHSKRQTAFEFRCPPWAGLNRTKLPTARGGQRWKCQSLMH